MSTAFVLVERAQAERTDVTRPVIARRHRCVLNGRRTNEADLPVVRIIGRGSDLFRRERRNLRRRLCF
jgi:hypothetical protein